MRVKCESSAVLSARLRFSCEDVAPSQTIRRRILRSGLLAAAAAAPIGPTAAQTAGPADDLASLQSTRRLLINGGGVVLSMDPQVGDHMSTDILVEDGKIRAVRPDIAAADAVVVDADNRIVVPGFIDTHDHCYQALLRNILPNGLLDPDYRRDIADRLTAVYTPDDVYLGTLLSAIGILNMGTTTVLDISQSTIRRSTATKSARRRHSTEPQLRCRRNYGPRPLYRHSSRIQPAEIDAFATRRGGELNLPKLLTTRGVVEFVTIEGARCFGLEAKIGSLTPGKDAHIVIQTPGAECLAGKVNKWKGTVLGFDQARIRTTIAEARLGILHRANYTTSLFG